MKKGTWKVWRVFSVAALVCLFTAACGGGSGGGDDGDAVPSSYTGRKAPAAIAENNAEALVLDAYFGGEISQEVPTVVALAQKDEERAGGRTLSEILSESLMEVVTRDPEVKLLEAFPISEVGNCGSGGTMTGSIDVNDQTGFFSGTAFYNGYCEDGVTLNGNVQISGIVNQSTGALQISATFNNFSVLSVSESYTAAGTLSIANDGIDTTNIACQFVITEGARQTYMDYSISEKSLGTVDQVTMSGRYYDFVHGYVEFNTEEVLTTTWSDLYPSSGRLKFSGANGTWATLTFKPNGMYEVVANGVILPSGGF